MGIFERWSKESQGNLDRSKKQDDATRVLYERYETLSPSEVIGELSKLHEEGLLSAAVEATNEPGHPSLLYAMLKRLAGHEEHLSEADIERLAEMLVWQELRVTHDCSDRFNIIGVLEKRGDSSLVPKLQEHLKFVQSTRDGLNGAGTHFYADLSHELDRIQKLIAKLEAE